MQRLNFALASLVAVEGAFTSFIDTDTTVEGSFDPVTSTSSLCCGEALTVDHDPTTYFQATSVTAGDSL